MLARSPSRFLVLGSLVGLGFAAACAATGTADPFTEVDSGSSTEPEPGVTVPVQTDAGAEPKVDAGNKDAGKKDSGGGPSEAGADAASGVWAPDPGQPCPVPNAIIKRACGMCGTEEAVCLVDPNNASGGTVSSYGDCKNEVVNGCIPGTTTTEACGNCGTLTKTCSKYCGWSSTACQQPPNSCVPTLHEFTSAGCAANTFRTHECTNACTWTNYPATCAPLDFEITIATTQGGEVSGIFPLTASLVGKRLTGTCPSATFSTTTKHPYQYVEVINPTDKAVVVSVWNAQAPGGPVIDTVMAYYAGSTRPSNDAERKVCQKGPNDPCPPGLGCSNSFAGVKDVPIPAFGSALIWFGSWYEVGSGSSEGNVKLVVRTESLQ